jgi:CBS domain-containing protein
MLRSRDIVDFLGGGEKHNIVKLRFKGNFYAAMNEPVRAIMLQDFPCGDVYMSIPDAARVLLKTGFGGIPILNEGGEIVGMVSERDFIPYIPSTTGTPVGYYMVRHVVTIGPEASIKGAARRMISWGVRRLPVVQGRELVGIVTTVDILKYFGTSRVFEFMRSKQMDDALSVPVQEIMSREVVKVTPETDVGEAAALMRETGFGGLTVVSGASLAGIVTEHDFLRLLV